MINIPTTPESFYVNTVTCWKVTIVNLQRQQFVNFWLLALGAVFVSVVFLNHQISEMAHRKIKYCTFLHRREPELFSVILLGESNQLLAPSEQT